jgi:hypothetical protein
MELAERETTITYDLGEKLVRIFSAVPRDQKRLERSGILPSRDNGHGGFSYQVPMDRLAWKIRPSKADRHQAFLDRASKSGYTPVPPTKKTG